MKNKISSFLSSGLLALVCLLLLTVFTHAQEQPLATRVEHFYLASDRAQLLFTYFKDTFRLSEVWPFFERGSSVGLTDLSPTSADVFFCDYKDRQAVARGRKLAIDGLSIRLEDAAQAQEPANPFLGCGLGVDHVGIAVRDLKKTRDDYEQVLSFKFMEIPPQPGGFVPHVIYFGNTSYLELQPVAALPFIAKRMFDHTDGYAEFAEKYEGAVFLGLAISSAKDAADHLKARNFQTSLVGEGPYNYVRISHESSGEKRAFPLAIFLIEYDFPPEWPAWFAGEREKGVMTHPNTARRLHSVWFAVHDLEASLRSLQNAGLEPGQTHEAKFLGAKGQEVKAGNGCLFLLQSADKKSALNSFLSEHHDGEIIGVSIEISDLNKARTWIEGHSGHKLEPYEGFYGRSILIPPELTHGVWMELFQH